MSTHLPPPRIAAIHDLSCLGRCALTVILPTLSVMGYQVVPIPTALLSTHTGGFTDLHFRDLTEDMEKITDHFAKLSTSFRAIYSGFLGSAEQIESVSAIIDRFGNTADESGNTPIILIDPVMGDDGVLYSTYTKELMLGMKRLSRHATVLTPNLTEACFLTDTPYQSTRNMAPEAALDFAARLLEKLTNVTNGCIVITGIHLQNGDVANLGRELDGRCFTVCRPHNGCAYPGTGDVFASVLLGELLRNASFEAACECAADFTREIIQHSLTLRTEARYGVALEQHLWKLTKSSERKKP